MTNIIVVFPKIEDAKKIRGLLMRNGYQVQAVCTNGAQALTFADRLNDGIIVCGYKFGDMVYSELNYCLPKGFQMLLIASQHILQECEDDGVVALGIPIKLRDLINTVEMMIGTMERRRRKEKNKGKERSTGDKQIIDDAKKLLIERNHLTEEEAHHYIQKCSMDSGNNLVETAKMVFALMKY